MLYKESTNTSIMQKTRENTILEILTKEKELTTNQIRVKAKMGTESCVLGLKELMEKNLIEKNEKTKCYSIRIDFKNKILLELKKQKHDFMRFDLDDCMEELKENENPFENGYILIRSAMYNLSKFTLERYSPKLSNIEKLEYDKLIERCNDTIARTFDVLESIEPYRAMAIRIGIDNATTIPGYEMGLEKLANNRQQRRGKKIAFKIINSMN